MATGSPWLVFGAASGITAEDLMFSTHLGSANMAPQSATPLLAPHCIRNPLFGTRRLAPGGHRRLKALIELQINRQLSSSRQMFVQPRTMLADINRERVGLVWIAPIIGFVQMYVVISFRYFVQPFLKLQGFKVRPSINVNKESINSELIHIYQQKNISLCRSRDLKLSRIHVCLDGAAFRYVVVSYLMFSVIRGHCYRHLEPLYLQTSV